MYKNVIWDFDGTLFNTYPGMVRAFKMALQDEGINEDEEDILGFMKISMMEAVEYYKGKYELTDDILSRIKKYDREVGLTMVEPFPCAEEVCKWIANNGRKNYILTHRGYTTNEILKSNNMEQYFTEILTKHSGFKRKPDPEGYLYLVNKHSMDKKETIIIGDRELEILAGKAADIKVCLYNTNNVRYGVEPDYLVSSLMEVKDICME